ncbi:MAG: InlB B-repeat-containing protein [Faecalibacillus faecis]|uniref:DUF7601 domain-containing protein n=2 Tax=Faecalibacillus faecis TaxID=1982628 RepID=UPI0039961F17
MKKRIIASILTVIMLMTMLQTAALAADGEGTEAVASTTPQAAIYLDQQHGADSNDGLTKESAVQSIVKANELAESNHTNDIYLTSFYKITGAEVWDLGGKTIHRYGLGGYMIELVNASASLTLSNVVIDGAEYTVEATHAAETDSIIKAANGGGGVAIIGSTMVMNDGTISNNSTYRTSGQGSYGAGVYVADYANSSGGDTVFTAKPASFEMNGGKITGNTALDYGGGVLTFPQQGQKITININNGEISGNQVTEGSGGAFAAFFGVTELNIKGGTLSGNSAQNYGGGVFLYDATNVTISGGTISENKASQGGGVYLWPTSAVKQTNGSIENNVANVGGGVCGGTYTMTGGVIKDNNNSLTKEARLSARGDGVYVGTAFNLGNDAVISTNNDVYLVKGSSTPKEGRYINVISPYTGASTVNPIQIHSEDITIEEANIIGTQLVHYTADTNGETAAAKADADGIFVPSWKMPEGLVIGQSKETGKTDWMTYVPAVKIQYQWVSTDNPTDVTPPADDYVRNGTAYTAKVQQDTNQGYVFDGWYTDEQCTLSYTDGTVLDTDTTLYGKWTVARVCVHYEWVSTDNPSDVAPPADDYIRNGTAYTAKVQQDTNQGYVFDGWYTDEQCTLSYTDGTVLDTDTTLYGKWTVARGNLSVSKTVIGNAGDTSKAFNFTVTLGNTEINGVFGEMTFVGGVATFVLKHGESKTATGLPSGITYSVTEAEANRDGYTTVASKASGSIIKNDTVTVAFTNTKNSNISEGPDHPNVPSKPSTPTNSPETGDTLNLRLWTSVMGVSLAGLIISLVVVKKNSYRGKRMK